MIILTRAIPRPFIAVTIWPFIFVRPTAAGDVGLIEHELVHYREQAWVTPIWVLRYLASRRFRLAAEVRAYRRQIIVGGITREGAAGMLLKYHVGVTFQQALDAVDGV